MSGKSRGCGSDEGPGGQSQAQGSVPGRSGKTKAKFCLSHIKIRSLQCLCVGRLSVFVVGSIKWGSELE